MKVNLSWRGLPLIIFLILMFFLWRGLSLDPHALPSAVLGKTLPKFDLPALDPAQARMNSELLRGHIILLNIWGSWCPACAEEQVFLMQLARSGVLIYGLNYKDENQNALSWLAEWGNPYISVAVDSSGRNAMSLGVYGAPETFLIDASGVLIYRHTGPMNLDVWNSEFLPKIQARQPK